MILSFVFPDYCIGCPLMELQVDNSGIEAVVVDEQGTTMTIPIVYCSHEAACETWQQILEQNKVE